MKPTNEIFYYFLPPYGGKNFASAARYKLIIAASPRGGVNKGKFSKKESQILIQLLFRNVALADYDFQHEFFVAKSIYSKFFSTKNQSSET